MKITEYEIEKILEDKRQKNIKLKEKYIKKISEEFLSFPIEKIKDFNIYQVYEIYLGLLDGLDVSTYSHKYISPLSMAKIRYCLWLENNSF